MAEIVMGAALSHSPLMNVNIPLDAKEAVDAYRRMACALGEKIRVVNPDVLIVIAQDHFRTTFYNNMPAFLIGVGDVARWGDWRGSKGPLNTDTALARHIAKDMYQRNFEPSVSYDMKVDHGSVQSLELLGMVDMPVIPILINAAAPPLPSPARCYAFGEALRASIQSFLGTRRVAIIGSGGLSHAPLKVDIENEQNPAMREFYIHGKVAEGAPSEDDRIEGILGRIDLLASAIRPDWDRMVLKRLLAGESKELAAELSYESIDLGGGAGGQEIRSWLAMLGALQSKKIEQTFYEPVRFLVTGMASILVHSEAF